MRYLLFRNDGIGDFINSTPLLREIITNDNEHKILIIASPRNYAYIKLFKNLAQIEILNENPGIFEIIAVFIKIIRFKADYSIVLKPKYYNYILSKFSGSKFKLGLKIISDSKKNSKKSKPYSPVVNFLMDQYETIDYSNNYIDSKEIHHSIHFLRTINNIFSKKKFNSLKEIKYLKPNIDDYIKKLIKYLKLNEINQSYVLFHVDEKWEKSNWSVNDFIKFFNCLRELINKNIFVTEGVCETKFNLSLIENNKVNKIFDFSGSKFKISKNKHKTIFVNSPSIKLLTSIVSQADLIIEIHGALTHISSSFDKPVIDLCPLELINYFKKWKPISAKSIQIGLESNDSVITKITEYLSRNDLDQI